MTQSELRLVNARAILAASQVKLDKLRSIEPYLIDLSLRENPFGARLGQTLEDKLAILPKLRAFGFTNILLGTLDYAMPDEPEVDDDFMVYLRDNKIDMTGGFAFTEIGLVDARGTFTPSPSQIKLKNYGVPNTLHEIYLSKEGMELEKYDLQTVLNSLPVSIQWIRENVRGDGGGPPRIIINVVDGCDAFAENSDAVCQVLDLLASQQIEGVSIEDDRGTFLPFQVGAYVAIMRNYLPAPLKILVHVHSGAGFENAAVIEALLNGADGIWGGLPKRAALIGHASVGELLANLTRIGNPNLRAFQIDKLLPLATELQELDEEQSVPDDLPILGKNAYRLTLVYFRQTASRFMDLPPESIGGEYGFRVNPLASDPVVIAGRLSEVTGRPPDTFPQDVCQQMVRLMRRDLRAGQRLAYDEPENLLDLYNRALASKN
jgi:HMGL-like